MAHCKRVPSRVTSDTTALRGKAKAVDPKVILEHHSLFFLGGECLLILSTEHRFFSSLSLSLSPRTLAKKPQLNAREQNPKVIDCNILFSCDGSFWSFFLDKVFRNWSLTRLMLSIGWLDLLPLLGWFLRTMMGTVLCVSCGKVFFSRRRWIFYFVFFTFFTYGSPNCLSQKYSLCLSK